MTVANSAMTKALRRRFFRLLAVPDRVLSINAPRRSPESTWVAGVMPKVRPASTDSPKLNAMTVPSSLPFQEKACGPLTVETR